MRILIKFFVYILITLFLFISGFILFVEWMTPVHKELKSELITLDSKIKISAYYVDGGATTSSAILITKKKKFRKEYKITHYDRFNEVEDFVLIDKNTIKAVLSLNNEPSSIDTFLVKIDE